MAIYKALARVKAEVIKGDKTAFVKYPDALTRDGIGFRQIARNPAAPYHSDLIVEFASRSQDLVVNALNANGVQALKQAEADALTAQWGG